MTCGRAAVVTDVGANAEWIEDGVNGFVAPTFSPVYIGNALERAWQQSSQWESMGKKAREVALQKIDLQPGKTLLHILTGNKR
jgi:glycosyltransferase involved in cell wall biosynthesis